MRTLRWVCASRVSPTPLLFFLTLLACGGGNTEDAAQRDLNESALSWMPLVEGQAWAQLPLEEDPYRDALLGREPCARTDFGEEYGGVEVSTVRCGYLSLQQGSLRRVEAGEPIELQLWHNPLVGEERGDGLIAIQIDGEARWLQRLSFPKAAESWTIRWENPRAFDRGAEILFHVHNHGANSYTLYQLSVGRATTEASE